MEEEGRGKPRRSSGKRYRPPETVTTLPVTNCAAGEMSQATASAISSGTPTRRNGVIASIARARSGFGQQRLRLKSVSTIPGATALTLIPSGPTSVAESLGEAFDGPLVAASGSSPGRPPSRAAIDEMLTIAPPLPPWRVESRSTASLQARMVAITLMAKSRVGASASCSSTSREAAGDAGVVDEPGERSEHLRRLVEETVKRGGVGDVGLEAPAPGRPLFRFQATVASAAWRPRRN